MKRFLIGLSLLAVFSACTQRRASLTVVPFPNEITMRNGNFRIAGADVRMDPAFDSLSRQVVADFAERLSTVTGKASRVTRTVGKGMTFRRDSLLSEEEYEIAVTRNRAVISASGTSGVVYAIQTLSQMLPTAYFGDIAVPAEDWSIPAVTIRDQPRFRYRGLMVDCARHFFSVEEIKRILDVMALHKLNIFHWHLTDDQGWRIEIKKYPKLTEIGAFRNRKSFDRKDDESYGGYYSQEQVREIVRYAAARGITVIPEIEMPGHILAALAACPWLGCSGGPYHVWLDTGVSQDVLCVGKESSYVFIEDVLTEVMELFPSPWIHIGGDECPTAAWERCPHCQKLVREAGLQDSRHYRAASYLQPLFTKRILTFLEAHGRTLLGWDEIIEHDMDTTAVVMAWRALGTGFLAAQRGYRVVLSPHDFTYLDYPQSLYFDREPRAPGNYQPLEKVYSYEPAPGLPAEFREKVLGVQANQWCGRVVQPRHLEYMLLPRLAAISEVQWCRPQRKDLGRFKESLPELFEIYDRKGLTYSKAVFGEWGLPGYDGPKGLWNPDD